jgi:hypothetical protein
MQTTALASQESPAKRRTALTLSDRCDRCNAQAFVAVELLTSSELLFCNHHYRKYEAALAPQVAYVLDNSAQINSKPSLSANAD